MIGVIGYEGGNHRSVGFALTKLGKRWGLVDEPSSIGRCDRLILPGVGSAGATMASLDESGLIEPLAAAVVDQQVPFLGICIGLQLLLDHSEEDDADCLGWIAGVVRRFPPDRARVPQIGWNSVELATDHELFRGQPREGYFYFVNSFFADVEEPSVVGAWTDYGVRFPSVLAHGNIVATQFHLEKSGPAGLALLDRFATLPFDDAPRKTSGAQGD